MLSGKLDLECFSRLGYKCKGDSSFVTNILQSQVIILGLNIGMILVGRGLLLESLSDHFRIRKAQIPLYCVYDAANSYPALIRNEKRRDTIAISIFGISPSKF